MKKMISETKVLDLYLSGIRTPGAIAKELGVPDQKNQIARIIDSPTFQKKVMEAEKDLTASVRERFTRNVHVAAYTMEKLSEQEKDTRVQFQATKDLLDRAGTAPTTKQEFYTPDDYARRHMELQREGEELLRQEQKGITDGSEPDTDERSS